ncbi:glycosyltransferase family 1 protein [Haloferax sp. ATB1]|uniref:glycosyltransferase family 4 protein n=1 Tax=Haloferax sp. ATB1 TaxID=1508454 RepID=UPI0009E4ED49|nr:glycosyltransferase family 1 protein [Haloferax sp. ATB1]
MNIGINARVFSLETPAGAAQVGIQHAKNLIDRSASSTLYGHEEGYRWFNNTPSYRDALFPWNSQAFGVIWERSVLPFLAANDDLDILFCPNANAPPITWGDYKTVVLVHHVGSEHGHSSLQRFYRKATIPFGVRNADVVVTVSEFSKNRIVENLPVKQDDVHVVYNGIDDLFFEKNAGKPIEVPDEYILFVGSADERKNLSRLIQAYNKLDTDCELVVVGPSDTAAFGNEKVNRDDIMNLGYVSREELIYVYENATLFAYPSLYEGFGLPPLEAAARGTPVVTSNVTAIPEVMGEAAEFVDPYDIDSIKQGLEIVHNSNRLEELSQKGRTRSEQFTWDKATNRLLGVFEELF